MKKILLFILLFPLYCYCAPDAITLSLAGQKLSVIPKGYYIKNVMLSQQEDSCIGYLYLVNQNSYVPVYFETSISKAILTFLINLAPEKPGLKPMIIRVNRFFLHEILINQSPNSCFELNMSFIRPTDQGLYDDFTANISIKAHQVSHGKNLVKIIDNAFNDCFKQYSDRVENNLISPLQITLDQLTLNPIYQPDYFKYHNAKKPRKALYRTWFDFRDNLPDTSRYFIVNHEYNKKYPEHSKAYINVPEDSIHFKYWGFSEGDSVYKNGGRYYSLLVNEGNRMITIQRCEDCAKEVAPIAIVGGVLFGFAGGLAGATIYAGIIGGTSMFDSPKKYEMDPFDGKLRPFDTTDYKPISSNTVFLLSKVSDPSATLSISRDGKILCELTPGNYCTLDLSCHYNSIDLNFISSKGARIEKNIPLKVLRDELFLLKIKKDNTILINRTFDQTKKDLLKERTNENTSCRIELFNN
jgi:hypothetical protein